MQENNVLHTASQGVATAQELTTVSVGTFLKMEGLVSYEPALKVSENGVPYISFLTDKKYPAGHERAGQSIPQNVYFTRNASALAEEKGYVAGTSAIDNSFFADFKASLAHNTTTGTMVWKISSGQSGKYISTEGIA